jgi:uncharacterized Zn-binding protein involved in type VI secretion
VSDTRYPKRILPFAVAGARTNRGAIFQEGSSVQEIHRKKVLRVGDKVIDPVDGEVTIISGLDKCVDRGELIAGLGSVLSNGTFIVDAGQNYVYWAKDELGNVAVFTAEDAHAS